MSIVYKHFYCLDTKTNFNFMPKNVNIDFTDFSTPIHATNTIRMLVIYIEVINKLFSWNHNLRPL
jgi:hypothetical protein